MTNMESNTESGKDYIDTIADDALHLKKDIKHYFGNFSSFIKERTDHRGWKDFIILIFISGASNIALTEFTGWPTLASTLVMMGIVGGFISYYVQGFLYRLGVTLSGGAIEWGTARNITLFSGIPVALMALAQYFLALFINEETSPGLGAFLIPLDIACSLLHLVFFLLSLVFCYKAARTIGGTGRIKSIIFLVIVPIIFTVLLVLLGISQQIY